MRSPAAALRTIYGLARQKGVSNEELHDTIAVGFGKQSLKDLTYREVGQLLDGLRGESRRPPSRDRREAMALDGRKNDTSTTAYMVNPRELQMLADAAALRGWDAAALATFCRRQIQRDAPGTMAQFNKVFWALKAMNKRDGLFSEDQWKLQNAKLQSCSLAEHKPKPAKRSRSTARTGS